MLGVLVPVLFVLALVWLASMTWRYEAVRPPYRVTPERKAKPRLVTAAALKNGLADNEFWDGEGSVRLVTWLHLAVVAGFLAIVLGVTTKALTGSPHVIALWWIAVGLGGATVALGVGYVCLDALDALTDQLRGRLPFMLGPAAAALIAAGLFAWLQPGGPAPWAADLPGMASVTGWTTGQPQAHRRACTRWNSSGNSLRLRRCARPSPLSPAGLGGGRQRWRSRSAQASLAPSRPLALRQRWSIDVAGTATMFHRCRYGGRQARGSGVRGGRAGLTGHAGKRWGRCRPGPLPAGAAAGRGAGIAVPKLLVRVAGSVRLGSAGVYQPGFLGEHDGLDPVAEWYSMLSCVTCMNASSSEGWAGVSSKTGT